MSEAPNMLWSWWASDANGKAAKVSAPKDSFSTKSVLGYAAWYAGTLSGVGVIAWS